MIPCGREPTSNSANAVEVIKGNAPSPTATRSRQMEERIQQGEEHARRALAETQARHKLEIQKMAACDQPADARTRRKQSEE